MIRQASTYLLVFFFIVNTLPAFAAEQPKPEPKPISMSTVMQNLQMNGYTMIREVDLENDVFEVDTITAEGKELKVHMNAITGQITDPKENPAPHISMADIVKKVEAAGYHSISKIEFEGDKYVVKALDQKDKKVKLKVNANTGEIKTAWF